MKLFTKIKLSYVFGFILAAFIFTPVISASYQDNTFNKLGEILQAKKNDIILRLTVEKEKVAKVKNDPILQSIFKSFKNQSKLSIKNSSWLEDSNKLDAHYVAQYGEFYDILFVSDDGLIFHSIKMESDFMQNIFEGELKSSSLSSNLRNNSDTQFVDYDYYLPSKEPAAFFVAQVTDNGKNIGWIVFQFAINAINSTLSDHSELGETGEIYLTNKDKVMITQSRLIPENTFLKLKVDTPATQLALKELKGRMLLYDYRGVKVFSVYEHFEFSGVTWAIIAEIDEDEVITDYYRLHKDQLLIALIKNLNAGTKAQAQTISVDDIDVRVDINEYSRVNVNQEIATFGVATCTAVIVSLPGDFAYLGHIYPLDDAYVSDWNKTILELGLWLKGNEKAGVKRDILGSMITRIKQYDIYPYEIHQLKVVLAAVHTEGLEGTIDKLLDAGIFLSQITILHDPTMQSVNVSMRDNLEYPILEWNRANSNETHQTEITHTLTVGEHVKALLVL